MEIGHFLLVLIAIFGCAKLFGELAERLGQPAVLGELIAGLVLGVSGFQIVDASDPTIHLLSELGVLLLLFMIGLETDLKRLLSVGLSSAAVALVGVALPFVMGYFAGALLGYGPMVSIFLGATLTATSVGITARVLSDLGHLHDRESQVILGAAVIDDIIGLVILSIVGALSRGEDVGVLTITKTTLIAFGFVAVAILLGNWLAPFLIRFIAKVRVRKALFFASVMFAFALALLAEELGSAVIIGAFAAGLVLARTERASQIEREVHDIAQFFIPIFFVAVGAAVDLRTLNPFQSDTRPFFVVGVVLTVIAIVGKLLAGWAAVERTLRRHIIGIGMIPRGEVGLIFAQIGLTTGVLAIGLYSSLTMMVIVTTLIVPPLLRYFLTPGLPEPRREGFASYLSDAPQDNE